MTWLVRQLPPLLLLLLPLLAVSGSLPQTAFRGLESRQANVTTAFAPVIALSPWPVWAPLMDPRVGTPLLLAGAGGWWAPHSHSPPPGTVKRSQCCGRANYRKGRIVGGSNTRPSEFPWMAALVPAGEEEPFCGGSLINDRYVLTAAQCALKYPLSEMEVVFGKYATSQDSGRDFRVSVTEATVHPDYVAETFMNDIALLKLSIWMNLPVGQNLIAPICLPTAGNYPRSPVVAIGWGNIQEDGPLADVLQQSVVMYTINNERCAVLNAPNVVTDNMICAGAKNVNREGIDACFGDEGGPLMLEERRNRHSVLGITSWGIGCARPRRLGVYTRVTNFMDWIMSNTADARYC